MSIYQKSATTKIDKWFIWRTGRCKRRLIIVPMLYCNTSWITHDVVKLNHFINISKNITKLENHSHLKALLSRNKLSLNINGMKI